jgi:hypothetical protein
MQSLLQKVKSCFIVRYTPFLYVSSNYSVNILKKPYVAARSNTALALLRPLYYLYLRKIVLFTFVLITIVLIALLLKIITCSY